ncbi:MAG: sigma-70 family RNA polymerase sigma factor, RNA polymerase sigma-70 factor, ECF subfamily [Candidatus Peregrinibacteria bacterium GW2011_GWF2_33_10]|nr:MAG: sigma-70 family RNA polymerase sigma factor, RNA polymerase sigma-70 factor, ECF subfamily [Candidatus Peregrinibacteria bacterium GW2011_GWF2_33_10]OGJ45781.1 MAG: hypothetical protein A2263_01260 [Candidatus Peregrinibacteria bacterium RIFOXYA2_FULL_33_21]OGJ46841.1 MAG: hypothetical protein A2272_00860 [Candidatus Peregrinibacteria bacterium RIFOXYA12_FULL_33_12]OGJ51310.1 MAG: hypothetical protein A2307_00535 [Candidatus Peregrinibacteria bacterium RIFOXYB2_FULL_33_20]
MDKDKNNLNLEIDALVIRLQQDDKEAFSDFYNLLVKQLYRYLFFSVDKHDIDDLIAVIFIKVWEKIKFYQVKGDASFKSWFFRLAKNTVIDFYRSSKVVYELKDFLPDNSEKNDPYQNTKEKLMQEKLKKCLDKLNENYREFLTLKFLGEFSNKEIAEILKKNESSLRVLQFRALVALKKIIEEEGGIDF